CPEPGTLTVAVPLLSQLGGGHAHLLTVRLASGITGAALTAAEPAWQEEAGPRSSIRRFFTLGLLHIATGYDHLLFLLALLLAADSLELLVLVITSFTLAHS